MHFFALNSNYIFLAYSDKIAMIIWSRTAFPSRFHYINTLALYYFSKIDPARVACANTISACVEGEWFLIEPSVRHRPDGDVRVWGALRRDFTSECAHHLSPIRSSRSPRPRPRDPALVGHRALAQFSRAPADAGVFLYSYIYFISFISHHWPLSTLI